MTDAPTFTPPEAGATLVFDGRSYTFTGASEPYTTRDGRAITLYHWTGSCTHCGAAFSFRGGHAPSASFKRCCSPECATARRYAGRPAAPMTPAERKARNKIVNAAKWQRRKARKAAAKNA